MKETLDLVSKNWILLNRPNLNCQFVPVLWLVPHLLLCSYKIYTTVLIDFFACGQNLSFSSFLLIQQPIHWTYRILMNNSAKTPLLIWGTVNNIRNTRITQFEHLLQVLVCTHLTELFNDSYLPKVCLLAELLSNLFTFCIISTVKVIFQVFYQFQSDKVKFYTMSVLRPDNNSTDVEDIVFLYRYFSISCQIISTQSHICHSSGEKAKRSKVQFLVFD